MDIYAIKLLEPKIEGLETELFFFEKDVAEKLMSFFEEIKTKGTVFKWDTRVVQVMNSEDVKNQLFEGLNMADIK